jgi:hypothetical protein
MTLPAILTDLGIAALGMGMPVLSKEWTSNAATLPTVDENSMTLATTGTNTWICPLPGFIQTFSDGADLPVTLTAADGSALASGEVLLLTIFEQTYLRLRRLYRTAFEPTFAPAEGDDGTLTQRPVPYYFLYQGTLSGSVIPAGNAAAGDDLGLAGTLTIHDRRGQIIDPLAVAAAFQALMVKHNLLQYRPSVGDAFDANTQLKALLDAEVATTEVHLRISDHAGSPFGDSTRLTGVTQIAGGSGLYSLNAASGTGSDLTGTLGVAAGTGETGSFPDEDRRTFLIGPATTGRLTGSFTPVPLPTGITLARDFFSFRAIDVKPFLLGTPPVTSTDFLGARLEPRPFVRMFEPLQLLPDGNDILGAANTALSGSSLAETLAVAQQIDGSFRAPAAPGPAAHWNQFPPLGFGVTQADPGPLPVNLRDDLTITATYMNDAAGSSIDVLVTIENLPTGASVKLYPRKFITDAREARGSGVGDVVGSSGAVTLLLPDPFSFRTVANLGSPLSGTPSPVLRFDLIVVKRTGEARMYGNLSTEVGAAVPLPSLSRGSNQFTTALRKSVCTAGILSLGLNPLSIPGAAVPSGNQFLDVVRALANEPAAGAEARDAPRLPTQARRDLLVASSSAGVWSGVIAAGRLLSEMHCADPRRGSPGGLGGRETQAAGIATQGGRLAYDIARMAFRRTTNIIDRMIALAGTAWNEPVATTPPAATDTGPTARTFCGAVLQTISPYAETPEFNFLQYFVEQNPDDIPETFDELVDWMKDKVDEADDAVGNALNDILTSLGLDSNALDDVIAHLRDQVLDALDNLVDNSPGNESRNERLFNELRREVMASIYGRRDAQWALEQAIGNAQRFIYIESPGFAATQKTYASGETVPDYARDLLASIQTRLNQMPGLHVIICTPRRPDYGIGYDGFAAQEVTDRRQKILAMPDRRVVSFHPLGFPGLQSSLESLVVIVDDVWALVGSSSFRRRGLTFDGGSDLVFTDVNLIDGRSPAIARFRRDLMAARLGISASDIGVLGSPEPHPTFVRLNEGVNAFYAIREMLQAGGLGKIERLWNGRMRGAPPTPTPLPSLEIVNPDGLDFDIRSLWLEAFISSISTSSVPFL